MSVCHLLVTFGCRVKRERDREYVLDFCDRFEQILKFILKILYNKSPGLQKERPLFFSNKKSVQTKKKRKKTKQKPTMRRHTLSFSS